MSEAPLRIGTRGSGLALAQAKWLASQLETAGITSMLVIIATHGDRQADQPIQEIGTGGAFTKELQKALLDGRIDVAVHSLKDLPTEPVKGLAIAAVPERESPLDALVSRNGRRLSELPEGARIGTGSFRRRAQLWNRRPDLQMLDIRGNVDTRLRKLQEGLFDALVLAEAGLKRLGLAEQIAEVFSPDDLLPAVGQGALGLECRAGDQHTREKVERVDDLSANQSVTAERALLAALRGGCLAPVGAWGRLEDDGRLHLSACVLSADGRRKLTANLLGNAAEAVPIGRQVAEELLAGGAGELIEQSRTASRPG